MEQEIEIDMQEIVNDLADQLKNSILTLSIVKSSAKIHNNRIVALTDEVGELQTQVKHLEALVLGLTEEANPNTKK